MTTPAPDTKKPRHLVQQVRGVDSTSKEITVMPNFTPITLYSTTGTAPIVFTANAHGLVKLELEDGTAQVYDRGDLLTAVISMFRSHGDLTVGEIDALATMLGTDMPGIMPTGHVAGYLRVEEAGRG